MRKVKLVLGVAFFATLFACTGGDVNLVIFSASPDEIIEGESSTLSWSSPGGAKLLSSDCSATTAPGSMFVSPTSTTTYHLRIRLASDDIVAKEITVEVSPPPPGQKRKN
jgi:hypothetical protein